VKEQFINVREEVLAVQRREGSDEADESEDGAAEML
jgi:hypothetical protein